MRAQNDVGYSNIEQSKGYAVLFGNSERGWHLDNSGKSLQLFWKHAVQMSYSDRVGDVTLFYNGKAIRSVWNARTCLLYNRTIAKNKAIKDYYKGRHIPYPIVYNKYSYEDVERVN